MKTRARHRRREGQPVEPSHMAQETGTTTAHEGHMPDKEVSEEQLLRCAYFKWVDEGYPEGQHLRHYFEAAQELQG